MFLKLKHDETSSVATQSYIPEIGLREKQNASDYWTGSQKSFRTKHHKELTKTPHKKTEFQIVF